MHQIGVLPILTYAEDHYELLSDPVSLNHVIDRIHPLIGEKLLRVWEFPDMLVHVPQLYLNFKRQSEQVDYVDLVQVASRVLPARTPTTRSPVSDALNVPALQGTAESTLTTRRCALTWKKHARCFSELESSAMGAAAPKSGLTGSRAAPRHSRFDNPPQRSSPAPSTRRARHHAG